MWLIELRAEGWRYRLDVVELLKVMLRLRERKKERGWKNLSCTRAVKKWEQKYKSWGIEVGQEYEASKHCWRTFISFRDWLDIGLIAGQKRQWHEILICKELQFWVCLSVFVSFCVSWCLSVFCVCVSLGFCVLFWVLVFFNSVTSCACVWPCLCVCLYDFVSVIWVRYEKHNNHPPNWVD